MSLCLVLGHCKIQLRRKKGKDASKQDQTHNERRCAENGRLDRQRQCKTYCTQPNKTQHKQTKPVTATKQHHDRHHRRRHYHHHDHHHHHCVFITTYNIITSINSFDPLTTPNWPTLLS